MLRVLGLFLGLFGLLGFLRLFFGFQTFGFALMDTAHFRPRHSCKLARAAFARLADTRFLIFLRGPGSFRLLFCLDRNLAYLVGLGSSEKTHTIIRIHILGGKFTEIQLVIQTNFAQKRRSILTQSVAKDTLDQRGSGKIRHA